LWIIKAGSKLSVAIFHRWMHSTSNMRAPTIVLVLLCSLLSLFFSGSSHAARPGVHSTVIHAYEAFCRGDIAAGRSFLTKARELGKGRSWDTFYPFYLEHFFLPEDRNRNLPEFKRKIENGVKPITDIERHYFAETLFMLRELDSYKILPFLQERSEQYFVIKRQDELLRTLRWATEQSGYFDKALGYKVYWLSMTGKKLSMAEMFKRCPQDLAIRTRYAEELIEQEKKPSEGWRLLKKVVKEYSAYDPRVDYLIGRAVFDLKARSSYLNAADRLERALESDWYISAPKHVWIAQGVFWLHGKALDYLLTLRVVIVTLGLLALIAAFVALAVDLWRRKKKDPRDFKWKVVAGVLALIAFLSSGITVFCVWRSAAFGGSDPGVLVRDGLRRFISNTPKSIRSVLNPAISVPWCQEGFSYNGPSGAEIRVVGEQPWDREKVCCEAVRNRGKVMEFCTTVYGIAFRKSALSSSAEMPNLFSWVTRQGQLVDYDSKKNLLNVSIPQADGNYLQVVREKAQEGRFLVNRRLNTGQAAHAQRLARLMAD